MHRNGWKKRRIPQSVRRVKEVKQISVYDRYQNCKLGLRCGKTVKLYKVYTGLKKQEDSVREEYAKKVFAYLSDCKPELLNRQDKTEISWNEAFGTDFSHLEPGLKTALVALVEQAGGRYRIIET